MTATLSGYDLLSIARQAAYALAARLHIDRDDAESDAVFAAVRAAMKCQDPPYIAASCYREVGKTARKPRLPNIDHDPEYTPTTEIEYPTLYARLVYGRSWSEMAEEQGVTTYEIRKQYRAEEQEFRRDYHC